MVKNKKYVISANIDEKMNRIILKIKDEISSGIYGVDEWDAFIETAILVFDKMIKNEISPFLFDSFIESHKKLKTCNRGFDA